MNGFLDEVFLYQHTRNLGGKEKFLECQKGFLCLPNKRHVSGVVVLGQVQKKKQKSDLILHGDVGLHGYMVCNTPRYPLSNNQVATLNYHLVIYYFFFIEVGLRMREKKREEKNFGPCLLKFDIMRPKLRIFGPLGPYEGLRPNRDKEKGFTAQ